MFSPDKGEPHEYVQILEQERCENQARYVDRLKQKHADVQRYDAENLRKGSGILVNAHLQADGFEANCSVLTRVEGKSALGKYHYEPTICVGTRTISKERKLEVAYVGNVLERLQNKPPASGRIIGADGKSHGVKLESGSKELFPILAPLKEWIAADTSEPPPNVLNKHCPYCPYRHSCHEQAEQEDSLSFLDRMTYKVMQRYHPSGNPFKPGQTSCRPGLNGFPKRGLKFEILGALRPCGRTATGSVAQQRVKVVDQQGHEHTFRRVRIKLNQATRDGATIVHILANLPRRVSGKRVADLDLKRWTVETAFQHIEAYFHSEINTLGYPKAALFGFCLALVAYNLLAVVLAALRGVHGEETIEQEVSLYYIANEISTTYHGMMIAIPAPEWDVFYSMSLADLAAILLELAESVRLQAIRKSPRRPKKPRPESQKPARKGHVATAKLLMNRQARSATP